MPWRTRSYGGAWVRSWPLLAVAQKAGGALRFVLQVDARQHRADAVELLAGESRQQRRAHAPVGGECEFEVLEYRALLVDRGLLDLAADANLRDVGLLQAQQIDVGAEGDAAAVGPRLAGDAIHHRRLACAVGADDAAQLADIDCQQQRVQRPDGQLLTCEPATVLPMAQRYFLF
jgi:hypothetical protein